MKNFLMRLSLRFESRVCDDATRLFVALANAETKYYKSLVVVRKYPRRRINAI